jgi:hypothetical protein
MSDKWYWFWRNTSALVLNTIILPIWLLLFVIEFFVMGIKAVWSMDGSEELTYPWEMDWPLFRGFDDE